MSCNKSEKVSYLYFFDGKKNNHKKQSKNETSARLLAKEYWLVSSDRRLLPASEKQQSQRISLIVYNAKKQNKLVRLIRYCMFTFIIGLTKDMPTNH
jgi:hypothetical protein